MGYYTNRLICIIIWVQRTNSLDITYSISFRKQSNNAFDIRMALI